MALVNLFIDGLSNLQWCDIHMKMEFELCQSSKSETYVGLMHYEWDDYHSIDVYV